MESAMDEILQCDRAKLCTDLERKSFVYLIY